MRTDAQTLLQTEGNQPPPIPAQDPETPSTSEKEKTQDIHQEETTYTGN